MTGISEILVLILLILCILIIPRMMSPGPSGKRKKNKTGSQGIYNENENRHCIVRSRHRHQCLMDKTLAGADFDVYRVRDSARSLRVVPCLDIFRKKKLITLQSH